MLLNGSSKFLVLTEFINTSNLRELTLKTKTKELALGKIKFCKALALKSFPHLKRVIQVTVEANSTEMSQREV